MDGYFLLLGKEQRLPFLRPKWLLVFVVVALLDCGGKTNMRTFSGTGSGADTLRQEKTFIPGPIQSPDSESRPKQLIAIKPKIAVASIGQTVQFKLVSTRPTGERDEMTAGVEWKISNAVIATAHEDGSVEARAFGQGMVTAKYLGETVSAALIIQDEDVQLEVEPSNLEIPLSVVVPLKAFVLTRSQTKLNVTALVDWKSSDPAKVDILPGAFILSRSAGEVSISATLEKTEASLAVKIVDTVLSSLSFEPDSLKIKPNQQQNVQLMGLYENGMTVDLTYSADWSSLHPRIASVGNLGLKKGLVSGVGLGEVTIVAVYPKMRAMMSVAVADIDGTALPDTPTAESTPPVTTLTPESSLTPTRTSTPIQTATVPLAATNTSSKTATPTQTTIAAATITQTATGTKTVPGIPTWTWTATSVATNAPTLTPTSTGTSVVTSTATSLPATDIMDIAAGVSHACAVNRGGSVFCWGTNHLGQVGDGTTVARNRPVSVKGLVGHVDKVRASDFASCGVGLIDGVAKAQCWGGDKPDSTGSSSPNILPDWSFGLSDINPGLTSCMLIKNVMKCWGLNNFGREDHRLGVSYLGIGAVDPLGSSTPVLPIGLPSIQAISSNGAVDLSSRPAMCAISTGGNLYCWGRNEHGNVGDGTTQVRDVPVLISSISNVTAVASGGETTCAIASGMVYCWGQNDHGQVGSDSSAFQVTSPVPIAILFTDVMTATSVSVSSDHACAVLNGNLYCWGGNAHGQLGDGTNVDRRRPVRVLNIGSGVARVVTQLQSSCAIRNFQVQCWGENFSGQLGDGTTDDSFVPRLVVFP